MLIDILEKKLTQNTDPGPAVVDRGFPHCHSLVSLV